MALLILSFIAGVLTIAAPCILPLLPIIVGGSLIDEKKKKEAPKWLRPVVIAASLAVSVIIFTLLIKASTTLLGVPQVVWQVISGLIVILLGVDYIFPKAWELFSARIGFFTGSNALLGKAFQKEGLGGAILIGAALGPVFNSCSPTYALIVATILPASFAQGLAYLTAYALGLSSALLLVAYAGQSFVSKLRWATIPGSPFKKALGIIFIAVGLVIVFGVDKKIQTYVLDQGWYEPIGRLEKQLRK